ncbi:MAG: type II and III secretion system protein family protein [Alphaproteobacteria bacterium]|nr:type II and III secretion system protein family protein [Alphaproteobacteria bacterium]
MSTLLRNFSFRRPVRLALTALLVSGMVAPAQAAARATSGSNAGSVFYVPINRSELITTKNDMAEVVITDPEVANVLVHGKRKVSIIGLQVGQTTLRIFDANHKLIRSTDVYVTYDLPAVRRAMKQFLPNEQIGVSMVNTRMALTGDVSSASAAATAMQIAEEFIYGKTSDDRVNKGNVFDGDKTPSPIINLMKISAGQQVMLRIRIGEAQRTAVKNLGVSLQALGDNGFPLTIGTGIGRTFAASSSATSAFTYGSYQLSNDTNSFGFASLRTPGSTGIGGTIEALERDGLIKILAEPNLTALSGEEAQFLAGGEFPIPVPQQLGTTTIEYKPFGVALKFTPYVLSPNRIRIQVNPEFSQVSNENSIRTSDGFTAPSFITRRASTTVELAPGESFMIAGLIRDDINSSISQIPGAGDIPVLGALFRSTAFQHNETELVIAVTPYLVDPAKGSDIKLPTDDFRPASFMESIFFGALGSTRGDKDPSLEGPTGFMTDN